jgi:hypothetical protein
MLGVIAAVMAAGGKARAVDFPGSVLGADVMFRNGELLSIGLRAGHLLRVIHRARSSSTLGGICRTCG